MRFSPPHSDPRKRKLLPARFDPQARPLYRRVIPERLAGGIRARSRDPRSDPIAPAGKGAKSVGKSAWGPGLFGQAGRIDLQGKNCQLAGRSETLAAVAGGADLPEIGAEGVEYRESRHEERPATGSAIWPQRVSVRPVQRSYRAGSLTRLGRADPESARVGQRPPVPGSTPRQPGWAHQLRLVPK